MDDYVKITMKIIDKNYSTALNLMLLEAIMNPVKNKNAIQTARDFLKDQKTLERLAEFDDRYIKNIKKLHRVKKRKFYR